MSSGQSSASQQSSARSQTDRGSGLRHNPGQSQRGSRQSGRPNQGSQASEMWSSACENVGSTERVISAGLGGLLVASGIVRGRLPGLLLTAAGASLLYRGLSGYCALYQQLGMNTCELDSDQPTSRLSGGPLAAFMPEHDAVKGIKIEETFTFDKPAHELYEIWTTWEKLPEYLPHIKKIENIGDKKTRWSASGPMGVTLTWEAEIIKQDADRMVSWKSTSGDVATAGSVHFESKGENKTEMRVSMQYDPPGGKTVAGVAEFFNMGLEQRVREDLQQFKKRVG